MKNTINVPLVRLFGIIAFVVVMGFSFIACDDGGGGGHTHDWGEWTVTTAPTGCTTEGEETRVCKLDATHKETQPIAALGHDYEWEETTAPTNITEGIETGTCKRDPSHTETRTGAPSTLITTTAEWNTALSQISEKTGGEYTLNIGAEIEVAGPFSGYSFGTTTLGNSLIVTLKGSGKLRLNGESVLINVNERQILIIDSETLTLQGRTDSIASVIVVNANGTLELRNGTISGNILTAFDFDDGTGGGVSNSGTFTMSGGKISGNTARPSGGGVYNAGTFTMSGGEISGNTANGGYGGGVYNAEGTFSMSGGKTSGYTAENGGGVAVSGSNATFTMQGGEISGNTAISNGGGVLTNGGTFRIVTGTIYGSNTDGNLKNTASYGSGDAMRLYTTAERGTFSGAGGAWVPKATLSTTNDTIKVKDGDIVP
jgi:hypothetical protein